MASPGRNAAARILRQAPPPIEWRISHSLWIYTMNRWSRALLGSLLAISTWAVTATPPIIAVNGKEDRLSPGARIRDLNNMLVLSGTLAGKSVYTVYKRDA